MLRDNLVDGGVDAVALQTIECVCPTPRRAVCLQEYAFPDEYAVVYALSVVSEVVQRLDGSANGSLPPPQHAVTIEHEHLHFHEEVNVGLFQSLSKQLKWEVHLLPTVKEECGEQTPATSKQSPFRLFCSAANTPCP